MNYYKYIIIQYYFTFAEEGRFGGTLGKLSDKNPPRLSGAEKEKF